MILTAPARVVSKAVGEEVGSGPIVMNNRLEPTYLE